MDSSAAPAETAPASRPRIVVAEGEHEQRTESSPKGKSVMREEPSVQSSGAPDQGAGVWIGPLTLLRLGFLKQTTS